MPPWPASYPCVRGGRVLDELTIRAFLATEYPRLVAGVALACGSRASRVEEKSAMMTMIRIRVRRRGRCVNWLRIKSPGIDKGLDQTMASELFTGYLLCGSISQSRKHRRFGGNQRRDGLFCVGRYCGLSDVVL